MTTRSQFRLLILAASMLTVSAQDSRVSTSAPVKDYAVSFFSDEGYPRVRVVGASADLSDTTNVRLTGMALILYSGLADRSIDTSLEAPIAILKPEPELVSGPDAVKVVRPDIELEGHDWSYDHQEQHIQIRRQVRVVFKTQLKGLLE